MHKSQTGFPIRLPHNLLQMFDFIKPQYCDKILLNLLLWDTYKQNLNISRSKKKLKTTIFIIIFTKICGSKLPFFEITKSIKRNINHSSFTKSNVSL